MSEVKTKNLIVEDLGFDDLSGGTEQKDSTGSVMPVDDPSVSDSPKVATPVQQKISGYCLPVENGKGGWVVTPIEQIDGEQFLEWAASVYPQFRSKGQRLNPAAFDSGNPKANYNKTNIINLVSKYYHDICKVIRKVDTEEISQ